MPRVCTVCTHAERDAIDRALVEGPPKQQIAAAHGLSETPVRWHAKKHLPGVLLLAANPCSISPCRNNDAIWPIKSVET
jgi:hypothetical protein